MKTISTFLLACGVLSAQATQAPNPTQQPQSENAARMAAGSVPIYRVTVVARTTKAINYNHRSGSTRIGFRGTELMPRAIGEAKVESKQGVIKIDAEMEKLEPATKFGPEYLTYVMWAITPEGRATNVGEVLLNGGKSKLDATTELQSFGLIITAEPYFAVTQPSDVVVMENFVRHDTVGTIEELDAKYELLQRGQYTLNVNPADIKPIGLDRKVPLELYEARNAVQIARWTGASTYAAETFQKALDGLTNAEGYLKGKAGRKPIGTVAREAVQMAEDARIITIKKIEGEQLAAERQGGLDREARAEIARAAAQSESERIALQAETARITAQAEAQRVAREHDAQNAASQADADRLKRESDDRIAAAQSETDRVKRDNEARAAAAQIEADRLKRANDAQTAANQTEADRLKEVNDAQAVANLTEADRLKRENDAQMAANQHEADRLKRENEAQMAANQTEANRLKRENEAQMAANQTEADRLKRENDAQRATAAGEKAQSDAEKTQLRAQLRFSSTRFFRLATARGLIVNMSDVLFDTAKFSLRPLAREKLARVAGILAGHPGLRLQVEGFTDSVGGDDYNQTLSENRASSVRDYISQEREFLRRR